MGYLHSPLPVYYAICFLLFGVYISVMPEALVRNEVLLCTKHCASILKDMVCFGKIVKS